MAYMYPGLHYREKD